MKNIISNPFYRIMHCCPKKHICLVITVLFSLIFTALPIKDNFAGNTYTAGEFLSDTVKGKEKAAQSGSEGLFTYGPYITLGKGSYKITICYEGESDNQFDITGNMGEKILFSQTLPHSQTQCRFDFSVPDGIDRKSIEIRTKYSGEGSFELKSVNIKPSEINLKCFCVLVMFILCSAALRFIYKNNTEKLLSYQLFCGIIGLLIYKVLSNSAAAVFAYIVFAAISALMLKLFPNCMRKMKTDELICTIISSYMLSIFLTCLHNDFNVTQKEYFMNISLSEVLFISASVLCIAVIFGKLFFFESFGFRLLGISAVLLGYIFIAKGERSIYTCFGVILIVGYIFHYIASNGRAELERLNLRHKPSFLLLCICIAVYTVLFSIFTIARYRSFIPGTFDFGIFAQMYEYMAKTGLPLTTCERDMLLSHFYIHFSPILYIALPFYMLLRSPEALLIVQAAAVALGAVPVFLICRSRGANGLICLVISLAYLAMPAFVSPLYWDFHENKFTAVMLLWFIYFFDSKKYKPMYVFMALTLMIKEETAVYTITTALFFILTKKEYKHGISVIILSAVYFTAVISAIQYFGYGLMEGHYQDYYYNGDAGVFDLASNIFINPGKFISNVFSEDTFEFIIYTMGALLFVPFASKDTKRLVLVLPYIAINLMTSYGYQHNVSFQYTYAPVSLLFFMFIINTLDMDKNTINMLSFTALFAACMLTYTVRGSLDGYLSRYLSDKNLYDESHNALMNIPDNASVSASSAAVPHLYNKDEVYSYPFGKNETDYMVFIKSDEDSYSAYTEALKNGYSDVFGNAFIVIVKHNAAVSQDNINFAKKELYIQ